MMIEFFDVSGTIDKNQDIFQHFFVASDKTGYQLFSATSSSFNFLGSSLGLKSLVTFCEAFCLIFTTQYVTEFSLLDAVILVLARQRNTQRLLFVIASA
jgi:hypothetical protein